MVIIHHRCHVPGVAIVRRKGMGTGPGKDERICCLRGAKAQRRVGRWDELTLEERMEKLMCCDVRPGSFVYVVEMQGPHCKSRSFR